MKTIQIILLFIGLSASAQTNLLILPPPGSIHLAWNYPSNNLFGVDANFIVRSSPDLTIPATNWPVIFNDSWTNCAINGFDGTDYTFAIPYVVQPVGQKFFVVTASNFWGESTMSNTSSTPKVAITPKKPILKKDE